MRATLRAVLSLLLLCAAVPYAADEMCGTSAFNDARVLALHERPAPQARLQAKVSAPPIAREGAFYLQADELIAPGARLFDLAGQSLVFEPRPESKFAMRREALRYVEPGGAARYDFETKTAEPWHYVAHDLSAFSFPIFGRNVTRVYLTAFNGIHFSAPGEVTSTLFDDLEAAVHRQPVLSPLMITTRKPRQLHYPKLFVSETADALVLTWRSTGGDTFGYDVQAELRRDGSFVYSYRSLRTMRWGAPIVSAGFDPEAAPQQVLATVTDPVDASGAPPSLAAMADIRRVEVARVDQSDLFVIRLTLNGAVDPSKFGSGESLRFAFQIGQNFSSLEIDRNGGWTIVPLNGSRAIANGASVRISGSTIEVYDLQITPDVARTPRLLVFSLTRPQNRSADIVFLNVPFDVPQRRIARDLSAVPDGAELTLPITEPFVLGALDPYEVYERLQSTFSLSDYDVDAVAIYQSFFTDIVFYAGAYSTGGNPQVDGIWTDVAGRGMAAPREPSLLHMNQLTYNWSAAKETASNVMLHEFGHRWLYFFNIREGGSVTRSLNPVSAHPAGYVHTPSAFPLYGLQESSVMGGGYFTQQGDGSYKARAANVGFSWTDLYLMGLAAPEEVQPWFYLANTDPPLAQEYWPVNGAVVRGELRPVALDQIVAVHGPREPSVAFAQKNFRVLFVLVTESGAAPTDAEVAKINEWRALMEKNFVITTGGRGRLDTTFVRPTKRRAIR
ncbi:MAG TPA: hypothetical protein VHL59_18560 [Thermoanaerobaculia bacterium]|nr:hypothetical protein [Thermoanaerobaculia bacterium]